MKSELYGKSCFLKELSIILEIKEKKEKLQIIKKIIRISHFTFMLTLLHPNLKLLMKSVNLSLPLSPR